MTTIQNLQARTLAAKIPGLREVLALCEQAADNGHQHFAASLTPITSNKTLLAALIWLGFTYHIKPYPGATSDCLVISWQVLFNGRAVFTDSYLDA